MALGGETLVTGPMTRSLSAVVTRPNRRQIAGGIQHDEGHVGVPARGLVALKHVVYLRGGCQSTSEEGFCIVLAPKQKQDPNPGVVLAQARALVRCARLLHTSTLSHNHTRKHDRNHLRKVAGMAVVHLRGRQNPVTSCRRWFLARTICCDRRPTRRGRGEVIFDWLAYYDSQATRWPAR